MHLLENITSNNEATIINRKDLDVLLTEEVMKLKSACADCQHGRGESINRSMRSTLIFRGISEHDKRITLGSKPLNLSLTPLMKLTLRNLTLIQ